MAIIQIFPQNARIIYQPLEQYRQTTLSCSQLVFGGSLKRMNNQRHVNDADEISTRPVIKVDGSALFTMQARPSLGHYLSQLWQRRHFIIAEARSKSLNPGADMILGNLWLILNPILDVAVYAFIFGIILKTNRGIENFVGFLIIGVIYFSFFNRTVLAGSGLIQNSKALITSFSFPKASLAFSQFVRKIIDNSIPAVVAVVLALLTQYQKPVSWKIVFVIPLYFMLHIFSLGVQFYVARATAFMPDLKPIVNLVLRTLFFCSGVFYSMDYFSGSRLIRTVMEYNPVYMFLMAVRDATLYDTIPELHTWIVLASWTFGMFFTGLVFFWSAEERYPRVQK